MSCNGCNKKRPPVTMFDRRGGVVTPDQSENVRSPKELVNEILSYDGEPAVSKTIEQLVKSKEIARERIEKLADDFAKNISRDMKIMVIIELLGVYNLEDISMTRISPDQALVTLWKHLHSCEFTDILREFPNLIEEVDLKHQELMKKKIKAVWLQKR